ncbi:uncharacterized protein LOC108914811 [Anoplophora glabripennis]|uniref:uncharacterized protein LOC108914811 n=1 Tax=Anoplophora glabripennis TaxID=217634 RepID=UPI000873F1B2|nr:uncharacterized protein LOC108914811 [Anoplophora glabripennis]
MDNLSDDIVKIVGKIFLNLSRSKNVKNETLLKYISYCNENIRSMNNALLNVESNISLKTKLQTNIGHLRKYRQLLRSLDNIYLGGGLSENKKLKLTPKRSQRIRWEDGKSAFSSRIRSGLVINILHTDPLEFLKDSFFLFKPRILNELKKDPTVKVNAVLCCEFIKESVDEDKQVRQFKYFNTKNNLIDLGTDLWQWYRDNISDKIMNKLTEFHEGQSGWALNRIESLEININKYEFSNGGTSYIELPQEIKLKRAVINIKNTDQFCFAYAVVSCLHPAQKNPDRISSYPDFHTVLNFTGINFPVTIEQIPKFEKLNNISINVYILKLNGKIYSVVPAYISKEKLPTHVNLLMIQNKYYSDNDVNYAKNQKNFEIKFHFTWIKYLSRLLSNQLTGNGHAIFICDRCLNYFRHQAQLDKHEVECARVNTCKISFPEDKYLFFKNFKYKEPAPFIVYCEFETLLKPFDDISGSKTERYQKHEAFAVGYYFNCSYDKSLSHYKSYVGLDCVQWFVRELENIGKFVDEKLNLVVPIEA